MKTATFLVTAMRGLAATTMAAYCAVPGQPVHAQAAPPNPESQAAMSAFWDCLYSEAKALDDHVSDAGTIATGVLDACSAPYSQMKTVLGRQSNPPSLTIFYDTIDKAAPGLAIQAVLRVRRAQASGVSPAH